MAETLQRAEEEFLECYDQYFNMVWKICMSYMKHMADTEDVVQETFMKYYTYTGTFKNEEHRKAWLIVTSSNLCKDRLRLFWRRKRVSLDEITGSTASYENVEIDSTLEAVMQLPDKYKTVVYMYYYEGYTTVEIADILRKNKSTVRNYLCRARELLKPMVGGV